MSDHNIPHLKNDNGHDIIEVGSKEFMCIGAEPPFDHPHIFINMGASNQQSCPYCSTVYIYNEQLAHNSAEQAPCPE